ncbi:MAG TPA: DUF6599 family protein [Blastocatellia bacterium]|nr:DUF6599 family protein [Blastocatellia bacterium]
MALRMLGGMAALSLAGFPALHAQEKDPGRKPQAAEVVLVRGPISPAQLLPDKLGGLKATSDAKEYKPDSLAELVSDRAAAFREYRVLSAASRSYGTTQVEVFQTENVFAAYGLFTYNCGLIGATADRAVGSDSGSSPGQMTFWKDRYVARLSDTGKRAGVASQPLAAIASVVAAGIGNSATDVMRPPLMGSLPGEPDARRSERYFLGPESLNIFVRGGREMFDFAGRAEAVLAEYAQDNTQAPVPGSFPRKSRSPMKLLILECHTPQFATDAMARATRYIESLPEDQQQQTILKREGNYILEATGFDNRESAQQLVDAVKYPYTVKWLRNPLWPTNDPWRAQKAAQVLVSTFALLGIMILAVLVVGGAVGSLVFLKRRKRQLEVFSDAGGMLRLELDPFDKAILGLPSARSGDE